MDPLAELKDIHTPDIIGLWPIAYGWWLLAALLLIGLSAILWRWRTSRRRSLAKRQALSALTEISNEEGWQQRVNTLLRRASLSYFDAASINPLYGDAWLDFLTQAMPQKRREEFNGHYQGVLRGLYRSDHGDVKFDSGVLAANAWLNQALPPKGFKPQSTGPKREAGHV